MFFRRKSKSKQSELELPVEPSAEDRFREFTQQYLNKLDALPVPLLSFSDDRPINFKHSGNAGDVIYAIPAMLALSEGRPFNILLNLDHPALYAEHFKHPLGNVMLNRRMYEMLKPLLEKQECINTCTVLSNEQVDVDLDIIRDYPLLLDRGNIARWYFLLFPQTFDLNKSWLKVEPDIEMSESIVLARSLRYRAPNINYGVLQKYSNVYFLGIPEEYEEMRKVLPDLKYKPVKDFLEMASVIAGAKLFIGNQSFPFSLAEALKVNRMLEVYFECPNVVVYGDKGYDFSFQAQFEKLLQMRFELL